MDIILGEDDKHLPSMNNEELARVDKIRMKKIKSPDTDKMMAVAMGDERNTVYYASTAERYERLLKKKEDYWQRRANGYLV